MTNMIPKEYDWVKIYSLEYWEAGEDGENTFVNGKRFEKELDDNINRCYMQEHFGKIVQIETVSGNVCFDFKESRHQWNFSCIEKILTPTENPEYYL